MRNDHLLAFLAGAAIGGAIIWLLYSETGQEWVDTLITELEEEMNTSET